MPKQQSQSTEGNRLLYCWFVNFIFKRQGLRHTALTIVAVFQQPFSQLTGPAKQQETLALASMARDDSSASSMAPTSSMAANAR